MKSKRARKPHKTRSRPSNSIWSVLEMVTRNVEYFSRKELHAISSRATEMAECEGVNSGWAETYRKLAEAADELDSRLDRCEEHSLELLAMIGGCLEIRFTEHEVTTWQT